VPLLIVKLIKTQLALARGYNLANQENAQASKVQTGQVYSTGPKPNLPWSMIVNQSFIYVFTLYICPHSSALLALSSPSDLINQMLQYEVELNSSP
jgi:hypothetical protein